MRKFVLDGKYEGRDFRNALGRFPTGVAIITSRTPAGRLEGLTANSFAALSLDPPLVLWSLSRSSPSVPGFTESGHFAINVLRCGQSDLSHRFATPQTNKYEGVPYSEEFGGSPVLGGVLASFECQTHQVVDGGDHLLFIGRVHCMSYGEGEPLIFNAGRYCTATPLRTGSAQEDLNDIWAGLG